MNVRIFFPKIPSDQDNFIKALGEYCNSNHVKIMKNKDGSPFCILPLSSSDLKNRCANDIIDILTGKLVGDIRLKPRIYVDHICQKEMRQNTNDYETETVNVTHYDKDCYFVQLLSERDKNNFIGEALKILYDEYRSNMLTVLEFDELSVGRIYASMYDNENEFYRIRVLEKLEGDKIKVNFIDYGNTEYIVDKPILEISEKLVNIPPLAYKCTIDNVRIIDEKKHDLIAREVLNRNYKAKLVKTVTNDGEERMYIDFIDFAIVSYKNYLIIENVALENDSGEAAVKRVDSKVGWSRNNANYTKPMPQLTENGVKENVELGVLTHLESLEEFYVQLANKVVEDNLLQISQKIEFLTANLKDNLQFIDNDTIYLSKFSFDSNWYRCKVIDNKWNGKEPCLTVQYIDFGNSEKKYDVKELKPLTDNWHEDAKELASIAPCANRCTFSKKLLAGLNRANIDRSHFSKHFILPEKIVKLFYYDDINRGMWIVNNVIVDDNTEDDFRTKYGNGSDNEMEPVADVYKFTTMESVSRMWFQLVSSKDAQTQKHITSIKKWSGFKIPGDIKPISRVLTDKRYCVVNRRGQLCRCRVAYKSTDDCIIQLIDTGIYDLVKSSSLYPLPQSLEHIRPLAQSFKLAVNLSSDNEVEAQRRIVQKLEHREVQLDLMMDSVIRDVTLIDGGSLLTSLRKWINAPGSDHMDHDKYRDLPHCLLPPVTEEGDVDFSLPSVDKMNEVPLQVAVENASTRFLRHLFAFNGESDGGSIFDELWTIVDQCDNLVSISACCNNVDDISTQMDVVHAEFSEMLIDGSKVKIRDLEPLMTRRMELCNTVMSTHRSLSDLMSVVSLDSLHTLTCNIECTLTGLVNLSHIFQISGHHHHSIDVHLIRDQSAAFTVSELYREVATQLAVYASTTDKAVAKLQRQFAAMTRPYQLNDPIPDVASATVPLIDSTYELHAALKAENRHFFDVLNRDDVKALFDVRSVLASAVSYLQTQQTVVSTIVAKRATLDVLNQHASDILADDSALCRTIEESHRKILASRSALRHAVPDLEDAEELELKDRQQELVVKIRDIRLSLHSELRASRDLIGSANVRQLMIKKPELQLKNQSLLLHEHAIPIFLWDPIYFDMCHDGEGYTSSWFENDRIKVKKIGVSGDDSRLVLGNLAVYSARCGAHTDGSTSAVTLVPVLYAFLAKTGASALYVILPHFVYVSPSDLVNDADSDEGGDVCSVLAVFKDVIEQIIVLWHLGFIYTDEDVKNGVLLRCDDGLALPLPVGSIMTREKLVGSGAHNINVYMRGLGALLVQTVDHCRPVSDDNGRALQSVAGAITACRDVAEAETVCDQLGVLVTKLRDQASQGDTGANVDVHVDLQQQSESSTSCVSTDGDSDDHRHSGSVEAVQEVEDSADDSGVDGTVSRCPVTESEDNGGDMRTAMCAATEDGGHTLNGGGDTEVGNGGGRGSPHVVVESLHIEDDDI